MPRWVLDSLGQTNTELSKMKMMVASSPIGQDLDQERGRVVPRTTDISTTQIIRLTAPIMPVRVAQVDGQHTTHPIIKLLDIRDLRMYILSLCSQTLITMTIICIVEVGKRLLVFLIVFKQLILIAEMIIILFNCFVIANDVHSALTFELELLIRNLVA